MVYKLYANQSRHEDVAIMFNCQIGSYPLHCLDVLLRPSKLHHEDWQPLTNNIDSRLTGLKGPWLSRGERLTLVNFVLSFVPLYMISFYLLPLWVRKAIDRIRRNFFWKGLIDCLGFLLVNGMKFVNQKIMVVSKFTICELSIWLLLMGAQFLSQVRLV